MVQSGTMRELPTGHPEMPGPQDAARSTADNTKVCIVYSLYVVQRIRRGREKVTNVYNMLRVTTLLRFV